MWRSVITALVVLVLFLHLSFLSFFCASFLLLGKLIKKKTGKRFFIMKRRQHNMQIYCIVATVAVIIYLNTLSGDFVHDDLPAIVMNRDVLGTNSLLDLLKNDFWGMPMSEKLSHKSYRPLTTLTFRYVYHDICSCFFFSFFVFKGIKKAARNFLCHTDIKYI